VTDYTATIKTAPGAAESAALDRLAEELDKYGDLTAVAVSIDQKTGALGSVFNVDAISVAAAAHVAATRFAEALEAAGVDLEVAHLSVDAAS